ncbi:hypothetical protein PIB30_097852 [Stylosanthes scabra]|uniref:Transposase MuDR plant domain-containing protein n=1 Tax=Stylosanthes scabra TaxID=79078 RepID=A0ABU6QVS6_9FABA|nr:hypothetical protein [Stylosanthes scabra]
MLIHFPSHHPEHNTIPPNKIHKKEYLPSYPNPHKPVKSRALLGTPTNSTPQKCVSPKSSKPTSAKPYSAKPTHAKPNSTQPKSNKPTAKPNSDKPQTRSVTKVNPRKGRKVVQTPISRDDGSSSIDSYGSVEDNLYMPTADELSSEDEDEDGFIVTQARKKDYLDSDVDLGQVFGNDANVAGDHDAYDVYDADFDGNASWESLEMKNPPNFEDEDNAADDAMPLFREWVKFGEVRLEVGMKFKIKRNFVEGVREFTFQTGKRILFKRNESYRCRSICKLCNVPIPRLQY